MQVNVSVRHGHLNEDTQAKIQHKVEKLLRFFDRITQIEVTVDLGQLETFVEIRVDAEHKHDFIAQDRHTEVTAAVDRALSKMEHQIHRYKEKIQDHRRDESLGNSADRLA